MKLNIHRFGICGFLSGSVSEGGMIYHCFSSTIHKAPRTHLWNTLLTPSLSLLTKAYLICFSGEENIILPFFSLKDILVIKKKQYIITFAAFITFYPLFYPFERRPQSLYDRPNFKM